MGRRREQGVGDREGWKAITAISRDHRGGMMAGMGQQQE
jgi:hypothetical protein